MRLWVWWRLPPFLCYRVLKDRGRIQDMYHYQTFIITGIKVITDIRDKILAARVVAKLRETGAYKDLDDSPGGQIRVSVVVDDTSYECYIWGDNYMLVRPDRGKEKGRPRPFLHEIDGLLIETNIPDAESCRKVIQAMKRDHLFLIMSRSSNVESDSKRKAHSSLLREISMVIPRH